MEWGKTGYTGIIMCTRVGSVSIQCMLYYSCMAIRKGPLPLIQTRYEANGSRGLFVNPLGNRLKEQVGRQRKGSSRNLNAFVGRSIHFRPFSLSLSPSSFSNTIKRQPIALIRPFVSVRRRADFMSNHSQSRLHDNQLRSTLQCCNNNNNWEIAWNFPPLSLTQRNQLLVLFFFIIFINCVHKSSSFSCSPTMLKTPSACRRFVFHINSFRFTGFLGKINKILF